MSDGAGYIRYRPVPLDTSGVPLTEELAQLVEMLAEHAHDTSAAARFAMGWSYGPHRDDNARLHPCLVPYADSTVQLPHLVHRPPVWSPGTAGGRKRS